MNSSLVGTDTGREKDMRRKAMIAMLSVSVRGTIIAAIVLLVTSGSVWGAAPPVITTASMPDWTVSSAYSLQLTASGELAPLVWTDSGNDLSGTGLSISTGGLVSGTPTATGTISFTAIVTDTANANKADSTAFSFTINPRILIISDTILNEWTISQPNYTDTIKVNLSTGTPPYTWSIKSGALPTGLLLNTSTGIITGKPTANPTGSIEITVTDTAGADTSKVFTIVINDPVSITTAVNALPQWASNGDSYSFQLTALDGTAPLTWAALSGMPNGMVVSSNGLISGTPTLPGTYKPQIVVRSTAGDTAVQTFDSLLIHAAPQIATSSPLPEWTFQLSGYTEVLTTQQAAFNPQWTIFAGSLPNGMTLAQSTGIISGQPLDSGTFNFTARVTDGANNTSDKALALVINPPIRITTNAGLPSVTANSFYSQQLTATGGTGSLMWAHDTGSAPLPTGLSISSAGLLSGTPTIVNSYNFGIQATDNVGALTNKNFSLIVNPVIQITSASNLGVIILDSSFSVQLAATGGTGNLTWTDKNGDLVGSGLSLPGSGLLTGIPVVAGTVNFTGLVTDTDGGRDSLDFTLKVDGPPIFGADTINTHQQICEGDTLLPITATDPNSDGIQFSVKNGKPPEGLSLNSDGTWTGTAGFESDGQTIVVIEVCDVVDPPLCNEITLVIDVCNTNRRPTFPGGIIRDTIQEGGTSKDLTATDPDTTNTLTFSSGGTCNLPGTLNLNANGSFSGDAGFSTAGDYTCSVVVCDNDLDQMCDTATFELTVLPDNNPPYMVDPPSLSGTTVSQVFQDDGAGVGTAVLRWRLGNSPDSGTGTLVVMSGGGGGQTVDTLVATVPVNQGDTTGLEVQFIVSDDKVPANTDTTKWQSLNIPFAEQTFTTPSNVWLDGADTLWHLVSIPGVLDTFGVRYIFEQLSSLPRNNNSQSDIWRLVRYNPVTEVFDNLISSDRQNMIQSGEGYWFRNHGAQFVLKLPAGATYATDSAFGITLKPGWNLFGSPFLFSVSIADSLIDSTKVSSFYRQGRPAGPGDVGWATAMAIGTDAIDPWRGYAVYNEDIADYTIYLDPHSSLAAPVLGQESDNWVARVAVNSSGKEVGEIIIGRSSVAHDQPDIMDNRTLTFFGGKPVVELSSEEYGSFQKDIRGIEGVQEWRIYVRGQGRANLTLSWEADPLESEKEALLMRDVVMNRLIDMTSQNSYKVPGPEQTPPGRFIIYQGAADEVSLAAAITASTRPMTYRLYQNYPNPFNPTTSIAFDLPQASRVDLELFNILGERVVVLVSESRPAGSYSIPWDGRNSQGKQVASGVYFARMKAGEYHSTVKLVLIK